MQAYSATKVSISAEDGIVQIAFNLEGSQPDYLILSLPEDAENVGDEFFGHNHYVELKDQLYGRYGGVEGIQVDGDGRVDFRLTFDVPGVGATLTVNSSEPLSADVLAALRRFPSL